MAPYFIHLVRAISAAITGAVLYYGSTAAWGVIVYENVQADHPFTRIMSLRRSTADTIVPLYGVPLTDIHPVNTSSLAPTLVSNSTELGSDVGANLYNFKSNVSTTKTFGLFGMTFEVITAAEPLNTSSSEEASGPEWAMPEWEHAVRYPSATGADWVAWVLRILAEFFLFHNNLIEVAYLGNVCLPIAVASILGVLFGFWEIQDLRQLNEQIKAELAASLHETQSSNAGRDVADGETKKAIEEARSADEKAGKAALNQKKAEDATDAALKAKSKAEEDANEANRKLEDATDAALKAKSKAERDANEANRKLEELETANGQLIETTHNQAALLQEQHRNVTKLETETKSLTETVAEQGTSLAGQKQSLADLNKEKKSLTKEVRKAKSDATDATSQLAEADKKLADTERRFKETVGQSDAASKTADGYATSLRSQVKGLEQQLEKAKVDASKRVEEVEERERDRAEVAYIDLQDSMGSRINQLLADNMALRLENQHVKSNAETINGQLDNVQNAYDKMAQELTDLKKKISTSEKSKPPPMPIQPTMASPAPPPVTPTTVVNLPPPVTPIPVVKLPSATTINPPPVASAPEANLPPPPPINPPPVASSPVVNRPPPTQPRNTQPVTPSPQANLPPPAPLNPPTGPKSTISHGWNTWTANDRADNEDLRRLHARRPAPSRGQRGSGGQYQGPPRHNAGPSQAEQERKRVANESFYRQLAANRPKKEEDEGEKKKRVRTKNTLRRTEDGDWVAEE